MLRDTCPWHNTGGSYQKTPFQIWFLSELTSWSYVLYHQGPKKRGVKYVSFLPLIKQQQQQTFYQLLWYTDITIRHRGADPDVNVYLKDMTACWGMWEATEMTVKDMGRWLSEWEYLLWRHRSWIQISMAERPVKKTLESSVESNGFSAMNIKCSRQMKALN